MKRWLPLIGLFTFLFVWVAGCGGDDLFDLNAFNGDASADARPGDATTGSDATTGDSGSDGSISDSGQDTGVTDSGEDSGDAGPTVDSGEDSGIDSGVDAGVDSGVDSGPPDAGPPFNVDSASASGSKKVLVNFSDVPVQAEAEDSGNYTITGLTVTAATLSGTTVTLTTSTQSATSYMVTVTGVTRSGDNQTLTTNSANFTGSPTFNVLTATSTSSTKVDVTFDGTPDQTLAETPGNYVISTAGGPLSVTTAVLSGSVVTLTTDPQGPIAYLLTVSNVTRTPDSEPLTVNTATFGGPGTFNVSGASELTSHMVQITFDAAPDQTQAETPTNYTITPSLGVTGASLSGNVVTLTTDAQSATSYTVTVNGVTRDPDHVALFVNQASFTGRTPFTILSAASTSSVTVDITFDADANAAAGLASNYSISGLTVNAASYNSTNHTVTLTTTPQSSLVVYTVFIANVARATDGEPLETNSKTFGGTDVVAPTVTGVAVQSTTPDNGSIPYNTGTTKVVITGTDLTTVDCSASPAAGVKLDDLDGAGTLVGTHPTSCVVDNDTQITAVFPAGIRTNGGAGGTGWNVLVTNTAGTNATSTQKFVPVAGLLVSEVYTGTGGATTHEFFQIYNPTANDIAIGPLGLAVHIRNGGTLVTVTDVVITLSAPLRTNSASVPHGGVMLFVSSAASGDAFAAKADYTYTVPSGSGLVGDGSLYLSLSATSQALVLDKAGWGAQVAGGFEGTAMSNITSNNFAERKPGSGVNTTDTDVNSADFNAPVALGATVPAGTTP